MTLILLALLVYSAFAGIVEGILYGKKGADSFTFNEHAFFVVKMLCLAALVILPFKASLVQGLVVTCVWALMHPLVHDGFYYETRRQIDVPNYRWYYDYSKTSTARLELRFIVRISLFCSGLTTMVIYYLIK